MHEPKPLHHPETVLFVDDNQAELGQLHILFHQGMSADGQLHRAFPQQPFQALFFAGVALPLSKTTW